MTIPAPHTNKKVNHLLRNLPWEQYKKLPSWRISQAIKKLKNESLKNNGSQNQMYYDAAICCLKVINPSCQIKADPKKHVMTDHAFCRGLERMHGINVLAMKDAMMQRLNANADLEPIFCNDGYIVTIIEASQA